MKERVILGWYGSVYLRWEDKETTATWIPAVADGVFGEGAASRSESDPPDHRIGIYWAATRAFKDAGLSRAERRRYLRLFYQIRPDLHPGNKLILDELARQVSSSEPTDYKTRKFEAGKRHEIVHAACPHGGCTCSCVTCHRAAAR